MVDQLNRAFIAGFLFACVLGLTFFAGYIINTKSSNFEQRISDLEAHLKPFSLENRKGGQ